MARETLTAEKNIEAAVSLLGMVSLRTAYAHTVTALEAGTYQLIIRDQSRRDGFKLAGLV
jgi:hypothetical protein